MRILDILVHALAPEQKRTDGQNMARTIHSGGQLELCRVLIEMRKSLGITQEDLAERLGCQQSLIARLESGQRRLDVIEFVVVARALAASPTDLLAKIEREIPLTHQL
jgi:DNA-binding XRE family transcriptional regulator